MGTIFRQNTRLRPAGRSASRFPDCCPSPCAPLSCSAASASFSNVSCGPSSAPERDPLPIAPPCCACCACCARALRALLPRPAYPPLWSSLSPNVAANPPQKGGIEGRPVLGPVDPRRQLPPLEQRGGEGSPGGKV
eukprot:scaffold45_cov337-Pavlova_lutheri.AAC.4